MKKFFTFTTAIALSFALAANAQNVNRLSQHSRSLEPKSPIGVKLSISSDDESSSILHKMAPSMKKAGGFGTDVPSVIVYESSSYDDEGNDIDMTFAYSLDVEVTFGGTATINGMGQWLSSTAVNELSAIYNPVTKQFEMDSQVLFNNASYGDIIIAAWELNEAGDDVIVNRDAKIKGTVIDDTHIILDTKWGFFINSGDYKDYYFELSFASEILESTGDMTCTDSKGNSYTTHILHTISNDSIYVLGFADFGESAVMTYDLDAQTVTIPNQRALYYGQTDGVFYTYAANDLTEEVTGLDISGTFTKSEITWGPWAALNNEGSGYLYKSASIKFDKSYDLLKELTASVDGVESNKEVARTKYYNVQGIESNEPQKGVNIQVLEYTDGSKKTVKMLK